MRVEQRTRLVSGHQVSAEEPALLAETILESLHSSSPEIQAAWDDEIASRLAALDRGEMPSFAAEEVFAEARHRLNLSHPQAHRV